MCVSMYVYICLHVYDVCVSKCFSNTVDTAIDQDTV